MSNSAPDCVTRIVPDSCFEFVSHVVLVAAENGLPIEPGQIQRDGDGRAALLHFAPRRWLIPAPNAELLARLVTLETERKGALMDVDGKWQWLRIVDASHVLGSAINLAAILRNRECAAVVVYDCPAIVALDGANVDQWVASSYLESFLIAVAQYAKAAAP